jgi:hypothetical protein
MFCKNIRLPGGGMISSVPQTLDVDNVTPVPLMSRINDPVDALVDSFVMIMPEVPGNDVSLLLLR